MDLIIQNVINPFILFFFLGMLAILLKSDLDIPQPLSKLFSLYLIISIGLNGGYKLHQSGLSVDALKALALAIFMAFAVPIYAFFILRLKLDIYNSVAVSACYGSVSAVTFITATSFLNSLQIEYGGYMVAALALMESPAIIVGFILLSIFNPQNTNEERSWNQILKEAFLNPSVFLLLGSLAIGFSTGEKGWKTMEPLFGDLFKGMLAFFLLDMGIIAARRLEDLKKVGVFLIIFAITLPVFNAFVALLLAKLFGLSEGDAFLFAVLSASASYIAVPAAMRISVPEANPSIYVPMALALTFPFNIAIGLPLYYYLATFLI